MIAESGHPAEIVSELTFPIHTQHMPPEAGFGLGRKDTFPQKREEKTLTDSQYVTENTLLFSSLTKEYPEALG